MSGSSSSTGDDSPWTPARRDLLAGVLAHILPLPDGRPGEILTGAGQVADYVIETLNRGPMAAQAPFVLALLEDVAESAPVNGESAEGALRGLDPAKQEEMLRALESDAEKPYAGHALGVILSVGLEGFYGDPSYGANVRGQGWADLGLTDRGLVRRLRPKADR